MRVFQMLILVGTFWGGNISILKADTDFGNIRDIAFDQYGNKWLATEKGVLKNGIDESWTVYTTSNGLINNFVLCVAIDISGNKWFGTMGGVSKLTPSGNWVSYTIDNGLVNNIVYSITFDDIGNIWLGTDGGVSKVTLNGKWVLYTKNDGLINNMVLSIAVDSDGNAWFGTPDGVSRLSINNIWTNYTMAKGLPDNTISYHSIICDSKENIWVATYGHLTKIDTNGKMNVFARENNSISPIRAVTIDKNDNLWMTTQLEILKFNEVTGWTQFKRVITCHNGLLFSINIDNENNKWAGGEKTRLTKLDKNGDYNNYWPRIIKNPSWRANWKDFILKECATSLALDSNQNKWIGTQTGLYRLDKNENLSFYNTADGLLGDYINVLSLDRESNLWVGTRNGISKLEKDGSWTNFSKTNGLATGIVTAISFDSLNNAWIGLYDAESINRPKISLISNSGNITNFDYSLNATIIKSIFIDSNNDIWFGALAGQEGIPAGGVWRLNNKSEWTFYNLGSISCIASDKAGNMWFGKVYDARNYSVEGVFKLDKNGNWSNVNSSKGLAGHYVVAITNDNDENIWFGTDAGVSKLSKDGKITNYNMQDGLLQSNCSSIVVDSLGNKWFLTSEGISKYNEKDMPVNHPQELPSSFILLQNFPNPFNPNTKIKFSLPHTSKVQIVVFNLLGEKIEIITDKEYEAGTYQIEFNAKNLVSGVYFYRILTESYTETKKMMLLR